MSLTAPLKRIEGSNIEQEIKAKGKLTPPLKMQKAKENTIPRWELASLVMVGQLVGLTF